MTRSCQRFRIEGFAKGGRILHAHVVGDHGRWQIFGPAGLRLEFKASNVHDAIRQAGKKLPFRTIAVRCIESSADSGDKPDSVS